MLWRSCVKLKRATFILNIVPSGVSNPPWSRVEGKSQVNLPQMPPLRDSICMGVTKETIHLPLGCLHGGELNQMGGERCHCRANSAQVRQSRPNFGLDLSIFWSKSPERLLSCSLLAR